jgi:hypothetical protein
MPLASFSLTGKASIIATSTSQSVALPLTSSPSTCLVSNLGTEGPAYIIPSTSSATVATPNNAVPVLPDGRQSKLPGGDKQNSRSNDN